jgi:hypothetical protein
MELASCHPSGTKYLEVAPRILENFCTPDIVGGYNTIKMEAEVLSHMLITTYLRLHDVITHKTSNQMLPNTPC